MNSIQAGLSNEREQRGSRPFIKSIQAVSERATKEKTLGPAFREQYPSSGRASNK